SSHIASGLIYHFLNSSSAVLYLFARSPEKVKKFISESALGGRYAIFGGFDDFMNHEYDVVINCIGLGPPPKIKNILKDFFELTEFFDNMALAYVKRHENSMYINMSSGAVYGTCFSDPADDAFVTPVAMNDIDPQYYYSIAKINAEAKHRAHSSCRIVDLRVFTYFSRHIDLDSGYLITDIIKAVKENRQLVTLEDNIFRDFIGPHDLYSLVCLCIKQHSINDSFDVYSGEIVDKFELLNFFRRNYGLDYRVVENDRSRVQKFDKTHYYSKSRKASSIGYSPRYTSLQMIAEEAAHMLGPSREKRGQRSRLDDRDGFHLE
ncbi:MAG: NAD(P)-dependent oxidoreductase, partial [Oligoflexales bacterium]|nr:NAD(P)-dependent oxidoreductase [Oligoflexales bacterium]